MFYAATATHPLLGSLQARYGHHQGNRCDKLPDEKTTRNALNSFFQCAATLFYVTTEENISYLIDKVYRTETASVQDLCELCALAAIGSHYNVEEIPDAARAMYYYMASTLLHQAMKADTIQGLRIFICLCMTSIMDKSSSARFLIVSALNFARGKMEANVQMEVTNGLEEDEYQRTLKTLLFLEGWLSYTLGYRNCLSKSEIDLATYTVPLDQNTENTSELRTRLIQIHMAKLTVHASVVQDEIFPHGASYWSHADMLSARLDSWHAALPSGLHLSALTSPEENQERGSNRVTPLQRRALYLMHVLYIDTRLQLFCQLLKERYIFNAEGDTTFLERLFGQIPQRTFSTHLDFAVQLARIVRLLYDEKAIMTRCWVVICASFDACIVLLLAACQRCVSSPATLLADDLFIHVDTCLTVLAFCGLKDIAANRLRNMLDPVSRELTRITSAAGPRSGSGAIPGTEVGDPHGMQHDGSNGNGDNNGPAMRIHYICEDASAAGPALVRLTRELLNLMSPGGNVWV